MTKDNKKDNRNGQDRPIQDQMIMQDRTEQLFQLIKMEQERKLHDSTGYIWGLKDIFFSPEN